MPAATKKGRPAPRSARNRRAPASGGPPAGFNHANAQLNPDIRAYVMAANVPPARTAKEWLKNAEIPTAGEMLDEGKLELPDNRLDRAWKSRLKYLGTHHRLLREDAIAPLRDAIAQFKITPDMCDDANVAVYEKVYITGFTCAPQGLAVRIRFSAARAGKKIAWHQSKRLISGSMVALTTAANPFEDRCIIAIVAARPLDNVMAVPPQIDLFFPRPDEIEIDPQLELVMIEAKTGYFEGARHTLRALQKMTQESFPLADHICKLKSELEPPQYVQAYPSMDLSSAFDLEGKEATNSVDVIHDWPSTPAETIDDSQWSALRQMLTTNLSIVQGPPGTGKTHVSVVGLKILLENRSASDTPIIVAAQTNHALDQILRHISNFDNNYIRLGGRSTNAEVKKHTMYEVRKTQRVPPPAGSVFGRAIRHQNDIAKEIMDTLAPLVSQGAPRPLAPEVLRELGIISQAQEESLLAGSGQWVSSSAESAQDPMSIWLDSQLIPFKVTYQHDGLGFEEEEPDDEYEQLKELEAERSIDDEEDLEHLRGPFRAVEDAYTCRTTASSRTQAQAQLAKHADLWDVPQRARGGIYRLFQDRVKAAMITRFRGQAQRYANASRDVQLGKWERDAVLLEQANIIGMTTTGFSKYRPLIASLKPKIVLVEEAAEVIEAPVAAVCVESLEHLILVGDHQQLQGNCNLKELEETFHLNVSMFERLVRNQMPFKTLVRQRRMDPEIRRILAPIYQDLRDHPTVIGRPPVPGMGDIRTFFFDHDWSESSDGMMSKYNEQEAEFVVGVFCYLVRGGLVPAHGITVLTFYNGQRKLILKLLKQKEFLAGEYLSVATVDSYQGEENAVVLLSLVRSNERGMIGFLEVANRVCVALSRARLGFYVFGNVTQLSKDPLWAQVIDIMSSDPNRVGSRFPVHCIKHNRRSEVQYPRDWDGLYGCDQRCSELLDCGHRCPLTCHAFAHNIVLCSAKCQRYLVCGHPCGTECSQECWCKAKCDDFVRLSTGTRSLTETSSSRSSTMLRDGGVKKAPPRNANRDAQSIEVRDNNINVDLDHLDAWPVSKHPPTNSIPMRPRPRGTKIGTSTSGSTTSDQMSRMSPERQLRCRTDWDAFANGRVQVNDLLRDKGVQEQRQRLKERSPDLMNFQDDPHGTSRARKVKNETQTVLKNGRVRQHEEYIPANGNFRDNNSGEDIPANGPTTSAVDSPNLLDLD